MNTTTYVWIVHSDVNENNIYAEFATEEEAIEYAKKHADELTWVDRVEVALDETGDILEMFDSETIWVSEVEFEEIEDDDFFAFEEELVEEPVEETATENESNQYEDVIIPPTDTGR